MKDSTSQRKAESAKVCQDVISRLDKFFGASPYSLEWDKDPGKMSAVIVYTDFFSQALVMQMLKDVMPEGVRYSVRREYSEKAVAKILLSEYKKNRVAVVDCYNGELHPQTIRSFVGGRLDSIEML